WRNQNGIKDERGHNHQGSNLLKFAPFLNMPNGDLAYGREGLSAGASEQHASVSCCIGLYGLNAGPDKHVIDENALPDPLLARLPADLAKGLFRFRGQPLFSRPPRGVRRIERARPESADRSAAARLLRQAPQCHARLGVPDVAPS